MPEFLRIAIQEITAADSSVIPSVSKDNETGKFNGLSATLSGKTSMGQQLNQEFSDLNSKVQAYSQSPLPNKTVSQPTPENRNSPSLSRD